LHQVIETTIAELLKQGQALNPLIRASTNELDRLFAIPPNHESEMALAANTTTHSDTLLDNGLTEKLRIAFIDSLPVRILEINTAFAKADLEELGRLFHGIRGSAAYLEDQSLIDLAAQLEKLADGNKMDKAEDLYASFLEKLIAYQAS